MRAIPGLSVQSIYFPETPIATWGRGLGPSQVSQNQSDLGMSLDEGLFLRQGLHRMAVFPLVLGFLGAGFRPSNLSSCLGNPTESKKGPFGHWRALESLENRICGVSNAQRLLGLAMEDPNPPLETLEVVGGLKTKLVEGPKSIELEPLGGQNGDLLRSPVGFFWVFL